MDGFFVAKFKKIADGPAKNKDAIMKRQEELRKQKNDKKNKKIRR